MELRNLMMSSIKDLKPTCSNNAKCAKCNNIKENEGLAYRQEKMGIQFKYIMPGTTKNGRVEKKFATLYNRVCATLNSSKFSPFSRNGL